MIRRFLEAHIRKLHIPLKSEEALVEILKRRLTKKEYKVLLAMGHDSDLEVLCEKLSIDAKRYEEVKKRVLKKINFHDLKEELMQKKA